MRCSNGEGWYGALIRRLVEVGIEDVERPRLERWHAHRDGVLFDGAPGQQRGFVPASAIPDPVVERIAAIRSLCRHRRSLDEVALRLAFTHAVDPPALEAIRKERPELWRQIGWEIVDGEVETQSVDGDPVGQTFRESAWPYVLRLAIRPDGRLQLQLDPPADFPFVPEWPDAPLDLHDEHEAIVIGISWQKHPERFTSGGEPLFERQAECGVCGESVYLPRGGSARADAVVVCDHCIEKLRAAEVIGKWLRDQNSGSARRVAQSTSSGSPG